MFVNRLALFFTSLMISSWGLAITTVGAGYLIALCSAASIACLTSDTLPRMIIVTSLPPSFFSHVMNSTSAVLHMISRASIAAVVLGISKNPYAFPMVLPISARLLWLSFAEAFCMMKFVMPCRHKLWIENFQFSIFTSPLN